MDFLLKQPKLGCKIKESIHPYTHSQSFYNKTWKIGAGIPNMGRYAKERVKKEIWAVKKAEKKREERSAL